MLIPEIILPRETDTRREDKPFLGIYRKVVIRETVSSLKLRHIERNKNMRMKPAFEVN